MVLQSAFNFRRTKGSSPWGLVEVYQLVYFANGFSSPAAVTGKGGDSLIKGKAGWAVSDAAASLRNGLAQTVICGSQYFWARASRHLKEQGKKKKKKKAIKNAYAVTALGNPQGRRPLVVVSRRPRGASALENVGSLLWMGNGE